MNATDKNIIKVGLGGGCHWCTEAVFQALIGVANVQAGWLASIDDPLKFSEGVIVSFAPIEIDLETLIDIHTLTHSSSSNHSMRTKYKSAIYSFNELQLAEVTEILARKNNLLTDKLVVENLNYAGFKPVGENYENYYQNNSEGQFCTRYIEPKLKKILKQHSQFVKT